MEHKEENIVKKVCKEFNITQKELAEMLDVLPTNISNWANGQIPRMAQVALEQMLEIKTLNNKLETLKAFKNLLNDL